MNMFMKEDGDKVTAIYLASQKRNVEIVKLLFQNLN